MFKCVLLLLWFLDQGSTGTSFEITSHFLDGNLVLTWPQISPFQDVSVQCNGEIRSASRVYSPRVIVSNVLDCDVTDVAIRATVDYRCIEKHKQFNLHVMIATEGESVNMTIPSLQSNITGFLFRINDQSSLVTTAKHLSGSYILKLANVTPLDAGYYGIGVNEEEATRNDGVVLVIKAAPNIPIISRKKNILRGETTTFTCNSVSRSRPHYYMKFSPIDYTWFVNGSDIKHNTQRLKLAIFTPTVVKCQAAEDLLYTSANILVKPLYGPERVTLTPFFNQTVTLKDGDIFGPVTCTADCNPPCHLQWKEITWYGKIYEVANASILPPQIIHGSVSKYRCVATGNHGNSNGTKSIFREINFNIEYGPVNLEMNPSFDQIVTLHAGDRFGPVTCTADCNPACHLQWKAIMQDGKISKVINGSTLPLQSVHAKLSRYVCVASGFHKNFNGVSSVSSEIPLNIQYGPDTVEMIPSFNQTATVHEGNDFGPVTCKSDCNPPCHFQWKEITWDGKINDVINASILPQQVVHVKRVRTYRCIVTGFYGNSDDVKTLSREFFLNIQYLDFPKITTEYNGQRTNSSIIYATEGSFFSMTCTGSGNPEPDVFITPVDEASLSRLPGIPFKSTHERRFEKLQCKDTQQYSCTARSLGFNDTATDVVILVECTPRLDESINFRRHYQYNIGKIVTLLVPIIAYPKPQNIVWIGGSLEAPRYSTTGKIISKENSNVYQFLVIGNIPIFNESFFGNFTLYTDNVEIVTITIQPTDPDKAFAMWNFSLIINLLGASFGVFSLICVLIHIRRRKNKKKPRNTTAKSKVRPIKEQTYFLDDCTATIPDVEDCGYENPPNPIDITFESGCSIRQESGTYINDGNDGIEDDDYEEVAVFMKSPQNPTDEKFETGHIIENSSIIKPETETYMDDVRDHAV